MSFDRYDLECTRAVNDILHMQSDHGKITRVNIDDEKCLVKYLNGRCYTTYLITSDESSRSFSFAANIIVKSDMATSQQDALRMMQEQLQNLKVIAFPAS